MKQLLTVLLIITAINANAQQKILSKDSMLYYRKMVIYHQQEANFCRRKSQECDRRIDSIDHVDTLYSPAWNAAFEEMGMYDRLYNNSIDQLNKYLYYKGKNVLSEFPDHPLTKDERIILRL